MPVFFCFICIFYIPFVIVRVDNTRGIRLCRDFGPRMTRKENYRHTGEGRYPMCLYFFGFCGMQWTPTCVGVTMLLCFFYHTYRGPAFALFPSYRHRPVSNVFVFLWLWWNAMGPDLRRGDEMLFLCHAYRRQESNALQGWDRTAQGK